ncbi:MAG TPA: SpoIIE family protein phosphatase [Actinomycetota bacterium]|nr:SpoIIE family protein phosphatase [Actinomycetota bacterium]
MAMISNESSAAEEHLKRVQAVTDAALAHMTVESLLDELLNRIRELLNADTAAVLLLDEEHAELVATAAKGIEEEVEQGVRLPVGGGFAGRIAATGHPVILESVDHTKVLNPILLKKGIRSLLGVPMIVGGRVTGVLHVGTLYPRIFSEEDLELLRLVADRVALAVDARQHDEHRVLAETLQRSLLPDRFPQVQGLEISGHYHPAEGGMIGGDWYDVFVVGRDTLCVVVGDVAGRGVQAAIAMGRLRNAVRAMVFLNSAADVTVSHLNDFLLHFDPGVIATMLIGLIDSEGTMRYASAGHVPPVLVDPAKVAHLIEGPAEPPLGTIDHLAYRERALNLEPGSTLILYTDGLVERRSRSLDAGLEALRSAAEGDWSNLEMLRERLSNDARVGGEELSDDLAILSIRFEVDGDDGIHTTIDADPRELAPLRRRLRRWLTRIGAEEHLLQDVLVAVGEAVANAVEHARGPRKSSIKVDATEDQGLLVIEVRDRGFWRQADGNGSGFGVPLMKSLMDEATFHSDEQGTLVTLRKQLDPSR